MYRLSLLIILFVLTSNVQGQAQKNHGPNFKMDCKACHNAGGWKVDVKKMEFNHETTGFKLRDQHAVADCKKCHQTLVFSEAKSSCISCHKDIHSMSVGDDCARCHTTKNWLVNNIKQLHEQNGFQMAGAHTVLSCIDCHKSETNQRWDKIGNDCASCHINKFNSTTNPNHKLAGFSTNCRDCHEPVSMIWGGGNFHFFFALTQGHNTKDCSKCHIGNNFKTARSECVSCHLTNYNNTTNPKHTMPTFGTNCTSCHTTQLGWKPVTRDFHVRFPLTGVHNINECTKCHDPNNYAAAKPDCASCHIANYNKTTNPKHTSPAFGTNCTDCHSTNPGWKPVSTTFHTKFALTYGHNINDCAKCHDPNNYSAAKPDCASCHMANYNSTTNPKHSSPAFGTNCSDCHSTNIGWKPVSGNFHSKFALTLGHNINDCSKCHDVNDYNKASPICVSCHLTNYNNTTNPKHSTSGFGTTCSLCHTTNLGWKPAQMTNHDGTFFPIYSGKHSGKWSNCTDCHLNINSYAQFSCIACHAHSNSNSLAGDHDGVSNYSYQSNACYNCHPTGRKR